MLETYKYDRDISDILLQPESETLEYKRHIPPIDVIVKNICAFANTNGGLLIIGVNDFPPALVPEIIGIDKKNEEVDFQRITAACRRFDFDICHGLTSVLGKFIYVIEVKKQGKIIYANSIAYVRIGSSIRPMIQSKTYDVLQPNSELATIAQLAENKWIGIEPKTDHLANYFIDIQDLCNSASRCFSLDKHFQSDVPLMQAIYCYVVNGFEAYLCDLLLEIYLTHKDKRKEIQNQLSYKDIFEITDKGSQAELVENLIKRYEVTLRKQENHNTLINKIIQGNSPEVRVFQQKNVEKKLLLNWIFQLRHVCTHNHGRTDMILSELNKKVSESGQSVKVLINDGTAVNPHFIRHVSEILIGYALEIDRCSIHLYNLNKA